MFPFIPLVCVTGFVCSILGLKWYHELSKEEQAAADKFAAQLALDLYDASLDRLSQSQADVINRLVRQRFAA